MPLVEIKNFNALIDNKPFFDQPVKKTNKKRMKNLSKCQKKMIIQQEIYYIFHLNLLNEANDPADLFMTRKWNIASDKSRTNYNAGSEFIIQKF